MNESNIAPSYGEIFNQIGIQLNSRKKLLAKRVLLITWPILLLVVVAFVLDKMGGQEAFSPDQWSIYMKIAIPYIILSVFYVSVARFIVRIEQQIWVD